MAAALIVGCNGPADHAQESLSELSKLSALTHPPDDGRLLGTGEDKGSNSTITGRDPAFVAVFGTDMAVQQTALYYQRRFPSYSFAIECCASTTHVSLIGGHGIAAVNVTIDRTRPELPQHVHVKIRERTAGFRTYVVVYATGRVRTQETS